MSNVRDSKDPESLEDSQSITFNKCLGLRQCPNCQEDLEKIVIPLAFRLG